MEYPEIKALVKAVEKASVLLTEYGKGRTRAEAEKIMATIQNATIELIKFMQEHPLPTRGPQALLQKMVPEAEGHTVFLRQSGKWYLFETDNRENLEKIIAALKQAKIACFAGENREETVNGQKMTVKFLLGVLVEHLQKTAVQGGA